MWFRALSVFLHFFFQKQDCKKPFFSENLKDTRRKSKDIHKLDSALTYFLLKNSFPILLLLEIKQQELWELIFSLFTIWWKG